MTLTLVPVTQRQAFDCIQRWHRHHPPPRGYIVAIGVATDAGTLVAVATIGRPLARAWQDNATAEVTRVATDGTPHVASMLYGACWRAAKALGYRRLITYTQAAEPGTSLRAAGWHILAERPARPGWTAPSRPRDDRLYQPVPRTLWEAS